MYRTSTPGPRERRREPSAGGATDIGANVRPVCAVDKFAWIAARREERKASSEPTCVTATVYRHPGFQTMMPKEELIFLAAELSLWYTQRSALDSNLWVSAHS